MDRPAEKIGTLMVIDDDEMDQYLYRRIIDRSGLVENALFFSLAQDALTYLHRTDRPGVDLITLDINMPRMNGFEFLEAAVAEFGEDFEESVVVLLTTSLNPSDSSRALAFPMVRHIINKPLTTDDVAELVKVCGKAGARTA